VTHVRTITTRPLLALLALASTFVGVASLGSLAALSLPAAPAGAASPLGVSLVWQHWLDDAPCGVAESSPVLFSPDGQGAVEFGDREGDIYAFNTANGSVPAGWGGGTGQDVGSGEGCGVADTNGAVPNPGTRGVTVEGNVPIDSTASVGSNSDVYFGAGNASDPVDGGYYAYGTNGAQLWNQVVVNPSTDSAPDGGVLASLSMTADGSVVEAGSLGQETYALSTSSGAPVAGWPQFSADSVFSTAAVGDLYGTGQEDFVSGGASSAGFALGTHYSDGGHVRIYNDHGGLICAANTNEEVDSSPAVGPILPGGAYGIATGTGSFYPGAGDEDTVKVFDTQCNQVWSDKVDGLTGGSPALADVQGNGQLAVVEGTEVGVHSGTVYALNAATGATIWQRDVPGAVIGSVTTADLTGSGAQDVIVPTDQGIYILDGPTGDQVADFDDGTDHAGEGDITIGFQNAPLITPEADGSIGITVAGYGGLLGAPSGVAQGIVQHFQVSGSASYRADEAGGWPQFHHDAQLSGFIGGGSPLSGCNRPPAASNGYLTVASDGGIFAFGQQFCGSTGNLTLNKPVVGMASTPDQGGYWLVASDGGIFSFGDAQFYGSTGDLLLNKPVVGMAATPDGRGYWLVASDGGLFSYGDAQFYGSAATIPGQDIVGMASTPDGQGYWEVSSTGRVFPFGDAVFAGDASGLHLNGSIVGMTADPVTGGYWLIGSDGGVFSYSAPFFGSTGNIKLNQPVLGMQATDDGQGYWFVASDGGIFAYGDAPFEGSMGGQPLNKPMVGMSGF
jgi:outer membrane protein assembly factor BamB